MNTKIVASLVMPIVTAGLLGAILKGTHHTSVTTSNLIKASECEHKLRMPFTGVAVKSVASSAARDFIKSTGVPVSIVEFYSSFPGKFNLGGATNAVQLGAVPLIQLNPGRLDKYVIRNIASGRDDPQITMYAKAVKAFKDCVIISFGHEMNGWWYHWGMPWNHPATFIAAWHEVHTIFHSVGANNVIWSWDPSHQYSRFNSTKIAYPASQWYPGNRYVNWVGLDGYLGRNHNGEPQTFAGVFAAQVHYIRQVAGSKLLYLAETSVAPMPGQLTQIRGLFEGIKQDDMKGLIWFEEKQKQNWLLAGRSPSVIAAYLRGVDHYHYPKPQLIDVPQP